jgi:hypothetical protein
MHGAMGLQVVLTLAGTALGQDDAELLLAKDGLARAVVVVAEEAIPPEKHAAQELADFLGEVTGATFVIAGDRSPGRSHLLVGPDAARLAAPDFTVEGLGPEELVLRTVAGDVILAGGRPRGTLYAVYAFLEDVIGCRWWTPAASSIPHTPALAVPKLDLRQTPAFEYREPYWGDCQDADWCARNRLNGGRTQIDEQRGGKYAELGGVHSFAHQMPPDRYFGAHPEWYGLVDGKRMGNGGQLCLTNPEATAELTRVVLDDIRGHHPGVTNMWVSQNDNNNYCQCEACQAVADEEGTPMGPLLQLVNSVAAAVEAEFPDVAVNTLAYDWSQKPPRNLRPRPNVIIWLCTTGCSYSVPYSHERNRAFRENLEGWAMICDRIYIWDYVTNFAAYLCPHPNLRALGPNARYFAEHRVKGVFSLGAYTSPEAEMSRLRAWVSAKLFWDPTRDADALIAGFLQGYFGPAAPHVQAYLDVFHNELEAHPEDLFMTQQPASSDFLNLRTLTEGLEHLRAAKAAAERDATLKARVEVAELPSLYVLLTRWDELREQAREAGTAWPVEDDIRSVYDRVLAVMDANGIVHFSEQNARDWFPSVRERVAVGAVGPPPGCEGLPRASWADLQSIGFVAKGAEDDPPRSKGSVVDPRASTGTAAWMPGFHDSRALVRELWRVPLVTTAAEDGKRLRCRISIRCERTGTQGIAFQCGIDGHGEPLVVRTADVADAEYHTYDMGVFGDLRGWIALWVSPAANPDNVAGVWVDRAWLVVEE